MIRLTRFPPDVPLVSLGGFSLDGTPTVLFRQWWQSAMEAIERSDSGTWLPTVTNTLNVASSVANAGAWQRIGNVVTASIKLGITPTAIGLTAVRFDLPVASDFANDSELCGVGSPIVNVAGYGPASVYAQVATNLAEMTFMSPSTTGRDWTVTLTYQVI